MRIRLRIERRWRQRFPGLPRLRQRAERVQLNLRKLQRLVQPRVFVVVFRTIFNAWYTDRRCGQTSTPCKMGCGHAAGRDSLEHYTCCSVIREFGVEHLRLLDCNIRDIDYWVLSTAFQSDDVLIRFALLQFAAYNLRNFRAHHPAPIGFSPSSFLRLQAVQGARGSTKCERALRDAFHAARSRRPPGP